MNTQQPNIIVLASGEADPDKGGSGYAKLIERMRQGAAYRIAAVVSNHKNGGVRTKTTMANDQSQDPIEFIHLTNPAKALGKGWKDEGRARELQAHYDEALSQIKGEIALIAMSGWMFLFDSEKFHPGQVINIHPGPTQDGYGGDKMHGDNVHEAIWRDYEAGKIRRTMVTMHYVTREYDKGPIIGQFPVSLIGCTCPDDVQKRVNKLEHIIQWQVTEAVANGWISWSGEENDPIHVPFNRNYYYARKFSLTDERLPAGFCEFDGINGVQYSHLFSDSSY